MERQRDSGANSETGDEARRAFENSPTYLRDILQYVVEIGSSLRLQMNREALLKRIVTASCRALRFRYTAIYLDDGSGFFRVASSSGIDTAQEDHLKCHPLPNSVVARIVDECYRISDSYFLPAEASIWQETEFASNFALSSLFTDQLPPLAPTAAESSASAPWRGQDLLLVPLVSGDDQLLGFLTPDFPLNGLRPTRETMSLFELFANNAAVVIEGEHLSSELREALRQAREAERAQNTFLLTASHELRTPLTAIQGYLELLGEYGEALDEASRLRFIQNARRSCDELVLLLGNVLDATYLDIEKLTFKANLVNLASSIQTVLEILEPSLAREQRPLEIRIAADLQIQADEGRLRQVLLNLLSNALKYTPPGSRLALSAETIDAADVWKRSENNWSMREHAGFASGPMIMLAVRDWGPGIASGEQALLFTKFTRLAAARKSSQRGAGLGLYLSRQLVEAMGGRIWAESSGLAGEGSSFFVALPAYPV
ncbi:MAG TPA: ATP-binding protein [Ktedonobacteraceae bacterium]